MAAQQNSNSAKGHCETTLQKLVKRTISKIN